MYELMIFKGHEVEVIEINGEVFFNPYHVAECLDIAEVRSSMRNFNNKQVVKLTNSIVQGMHFRKLHNTGENFLTVSGVFKLGFQSHKPDAEEFQNWVTDEVLPSIYKHGVYATDEMMNKIIQDPDFGIKLFTELKAEREKNKQLEAENLKKEQLIGELKPKADYTDLILQNDSVIAVTQIAKDYGMSAISFNELLHDLHIQYKMCGQWVLYAEHHNKGYAHSATTLYANGKGSCMVTMWTQKGRLFLYNLLKKHCVLPLIEQEQRQLTLY